MKEHPFTYNCSCKSCVPEQRRRREAAAYGRKVICYCFMWVVLLAFGWCIMLALDVGSALWNVERYSIALRLVTGR